MTDKELIESLRELLGVSSKDSNEDVYSRVLFYINQAGKKEDTRSVITTAQEFMQQMTPSETLAAIQMFGLFLAFLKQSLDTYNDDNNNDT